jgi:hypothetical protein
MRNRFLLPLYCTLRNRPGHPPGQSNFSRLAAKNRLSWLAAAAARPSRFRIQARELAARRLGDAHDEGLTGRDDWREFGPCGLASGVTVSCRPPKEYN